MFEEFFNKCEIQYPETVTAEQSEKIKASLRKMVGENPQTKKPAKEENIMKTKTIRTVVIAAAIAALGAIGVAGAASAPRFQSWEDFQQVANELKEKNSVSDNFFEVNERVPSYWEMDEVNELLVTEMNDEWLQADIQHGFTNRIYLTHFEETVGTSVFIVPDGRGGYFIDGTEPTPIEDEKLLAAIKEGTEKFGKNFMIWY